MACFKGEFSLDWLLELTSSKATELLKKINYTIHEGLLEEVESGIYRFKNEGARLEIEQGLPEEEREANRESIIELLKSDISDDSTRQMELSRHLLTISNDREGCRWLAVAGDAYGRSANFVSAIACYTKVIKDLQSEEDDESRLLYIETVNKFLNILVARQDSDWATTIIENALEKAIRIRHLAFQTLMKMHLAINQWQRGEQKLAIQTSDEAWLKAKKIEDPRFIKPITTISAFMSYWQGNFHRTIEIYEHSVQDVDTFPRGMFPLYAATTVAHSYAIIGQVSHGLGMLDAIYSHAMEIGRYNIAGYAVCSIGQIMTMIGRVDEVYDSLLSTKDDELPKYDERLKAEITLLLAFVYYMKGENNASIAVLRDYFNILESAGIPRTINIYLLYLCWDAEMGIYPAIEGLSLQEELESAVNGEQILYRGIGLRFKALLAKQKGESPEMVLDLLDRSETSLRESGIVAEVARTQLERARQLLEMNRESEAREAARKAADLYDRFSELEFPEDLKPLVSSTQHRDNLLEEILKLGQDVVTIRSKRELARYIISTVTRIAGAERGAIFLVKPGFSPVEFTFRAAKNLTPEDINRPDFGPNMTLIREVFASAKGIIRKVAIEDPESYTSFGKVRSCICVPMMIQDRIVGVLYNDNRFLHSAFKESDLPTFTYFAALTAIAMDNAEAYDEIQRLNRKMGEEKQYYREQHLESMQYDNFVGKSRLILNMLDKVRQVAEADTTVLIMGETGVGKEVVSGIILDNSPRRDKPFICVNCSAFSETLIASELFGHEKGAFTGANERRIGRFELADGGTLFLDEIGDIPMEVQVRLLRVLQTKDFERVGGTKTLKSDFRLIAATNQDLKALVKSGQFREDLYYRLNVFPIKVPPLRKRSEDIPLLALYFLRKFAMKTGKPFTQISEADMKMLKSYHWPGNVRELENIMERAVVMSCEDRFHIPELEARESLSPERDGAVTMAEVEQQHIIWALNKTNWKIRGSGGAAELLGMHYSTLRSRIKKHGIKKQLVAIS